MRQALIFQIYGLVLMTPTVVFEALAKCTWLCFYLKKFFIVLLQQSEGRDHTSSPLLPDGVACTNLGCAFPTESPGGPAGRTQSYTDNRARWVLLLKVNDECIFFLHITQRGWMLMLCQLYSFRGFFCCFFLFVCFLFGFFVKLSCQQPLVDVEDMSIRPQSQGAVSFQHWD